LTGAIIARAVMRAVLHRDLKDFVVFEDIKDLKKGIGNREDFSIFATPNF
jgi:hypothetical protein